MAELMDQALLLRRIPYSETSLICHFLTPAHGRVTLMARGARGAKSPFRATLAPLYRLHIRWRPGRSGMGTLLDAGRAGMLVDEAYMLDGLQLLAIASQLFQEGDPHGFSELSDAMTLLASRHQDEGLCAAFWLLLDRAGLLGDLLHCWQCGEAVADAALMAWKGAQLICSDCGEGGAVSPGMRKGIAGVMRQGNVRLSARDLQHWRMMIGQVMREHGMKLPEGFRQLSPQPK
ncbi:DNA repair protein RecO [Mariprofundus erugo]|uniref:DNA repair protein RecO n=1 Tax=Mariprofundus erugo TaxID=2528639 RepID=A0A5R9GRU5_9PROT|nr:DNA repair protein RecO [Mariprofundus erugo]TLS65964.1 DNA repair protein RecO [Mariprofundus erugo]